MKLHKINSTYEYIIEPTGRYQWLNENFWIDMAHPTNGMQSVYKGNAFFNHNHLRLYYEI